MLIMLLFKCTVEFRKGNQWRDNREETEIEKHGGGMS